MSLNDFEIIQNIGNEEKGLIFKVRRKKDRIIYALKTIKFQNLDKIAKKSVINEIKIISSLNHPNIVEFKEAFFDKASNSLNLILEFPNNGNLSNKINFAIKNKMFLEECIIWNVLTQILHGLSYLKKKRILHRNLKTKNIFLTKLRLVKITDFNACYILEKNKMATSQVGTPFYTAPEIWNDQPYDYKCDIWSLGCIIYEMATLSLPFTGDNIETLYENIMSKKLKPIPDFYSENLKNIIMNMLTFDPSKRPNVDILLNYPKIKETTNQLKSVYENYKISKKKKFKKKKTYQQKKIIANESKKALNNSPKIKSFTNNKSNKIIYKGKDINSISIVNKKENKEENLTKEDNILKKNMKIINSRNETYSLSNKKNHNLKGIFNYDINLNRNMLNNENKKIIKNATYRTLRERYQNSHEKEIDEIRKSSELVHYKNISENKDRSRIINNNMNHISPNIKNLNRRINIENSMSLFSSNINLFENKKLMDFLQSKNNKKMNNKTNNLKGSEYKINNINYLKINNNIMDNDLNSLEKEHKITRSTHSKSPINNNELYFSLYSQTLYKTPSKIINKVNENINEKRFNNFNNKIFSKERSNSNNLERNLSYFNKINNKIKPLNNFIKRISHKEFQIHPKKVTQNNNKLHNMNSFYLSDIKKENKKLTNRNNNKELETMIKNDSKIITNEKNIYNNYNKYIRNNINNEPSIKMNNTAEIIDNNKNIIPHILNYNNFNKNLSTYNKNPINFNNSKILSYRDKDFKLWNCIKDIQNNIKNSNSYVINIKKFKNFQDNEDISNLSLANLKGNNISQFNKNFFKKNFDNSRKVNNYQKI